MAKAGSKPPPPIVVIYGDEEYQKAEAVRRALDALLPPQVDRSLALSEYDGAQTEDRGGPSLAAVMDDLITLPFLADRRVVLIREADKFISAYREKLEAYLRAPSPTATLVLTARSFPKTTRVSKAAVAGGGRLVECKKLSGKRVVDFIVDQTGARGKRIAYPVAQRLAALVGEEQGAIASEIEKLCLYIGDRSEISDTDVSDLVGRTREEKIFAVMDAAAAGRPADAMRLWQQVLATDPAAAFRAVGGVAFVLRKWLAAHQMLAEGLSIRAIAPKVMMWGRERELEALLARVGPSRLKRFLAQLAQMDTQAKLGTRSIGRGVEGLLLQIATTAA